MNIHSHLLPEMKPGKQSGAVDESAVMDNTLSGSFLSRNLPENLTWLQDAGMGLFIHWSLDAQLGCVISHTLVGASDDYVERFYIELPKTLEKGEWDFDHLAHLARLCGFQYAVLTTKHHSGFCLWPSKSTDFHIGNTAEGKDLVAEYAAAFRRQGIKVGFYFSPEDFWFLRKMGLPITRSPREPYPEEIHQAYRQHLKIQMEELMEHGPVDVLFFDGGESMVGEDGISLQQYCMQIAWDIRPEVLITRGAIPTPEQQLPGVGADQAWEACITLGTAWQYQPTNEIYKTGAHVIRLLVDTRAKGGALLLNIGPDARGVLCREQENILRELALWHFINGEALHFVRPWVLVSEEDQERTIYLLKKKDEDTVYAVIFTEEEWDRGQRRTITLHSVRTGEKTTVSLLGQSGEETEYRPDLDAHTYFRQEKDRLIIDVMNTQRVYCGIQWRNPLVLKLTDVRPAFVPMMIEQGESTVSDGKVLLKAHVRDLGSFDEAFLHFEYRVYPGFALSSYEEGWKEAGKMRVTGKGSYETVLENLPAGVTYQWKCILENEQNRMQTEMALFYL